MKQFKTFALVLTVVVALVLCRYLPEIVVGGHKMRAVNLFEGVQKESVAQAKEPEKVWEEEPVMEEEGIPDKEESAESETLAEDSVSENPEETEPNLIQESEPEVADTLSTLQPEMAEDFRNSGIQGLPKAVETQSAQDAPEEGPVLLDPDTLMAVDPDKILDFSISGRGMEPFYEALSRLENNPGQVNRPVRVAYFGDSYIQGDMFSGEFRALLQERFGGSGAGWVDMTSICNYFRRTVRHEFKNWRRHLSTDTTGFSSRLQGISNSYHQPYNGAWTELSGQDKYLHHLDSAGMSALYFRAPCGGTVRAVVNGSETETFELDSIPSVQSLMVRGGIRSVRWEVTNVTDSMIFYGASMDPAVGVTVDNFSLQGSSGTPLGRIPIQTLRQLGAVRQYDLIVLQFGLNVAYSGRKNYERYVEQMSSVIEKMKLAFPTAGILVVGVSDRAVRGEGGKMVTMSSIRYLMASQRFLAEKCDVAFWNLYKAMGGEGSIAKLVSASKANYDYTHINFNGAQDLAQIFYDAVIEGYEAYIGGEIGLE